jgi:hypothetical protein
MFSNRGAASLCLPLFVLTIGTLVVASCGAKTYNCGNWMYWVGDIATDLVLTEQRQYSIFTAGS